MKPKLILAWASWLCIVGERCSMGTGLNPLPHWSCQWQYLGSKGSRVKEFGERNANLDNQDWHSGSRHQHWQPIIRIRKLFKKKKSHFWTNRQIALCPGVPRTSRQLPGSSPKREWEVPGKEKKYHFHEFPAFSMTSQMCTKWSNVYQFMYFSIKKNQMRKKKVQLEFWLQH